MQIAPSPYFPRKPIPKNSCVKRKERERTTILERANAKKMTREEEMCIQRLTAHPLEGGRDSGEEEKEEEKQMNRVEEGERDPKSWKKRKDEDTEGQSGPLLPSGPSPCSTLMSAGPLQWCCQPGATWWASPSGLHQHITALS